jgi:uncharacterized peroxidase-related enzyme
LQGTGPEVVEALARGEIDEGGLPETERALLEFVRKVTCHAYRVTEQDTQGLREQGFSDEQIAEAVYITALFALFNRVADAFGLQDPGYRALADSGQAPPPPADKYE